MKRRNAMSSSELARREQDLFGPLEAVAKLPPGSISLVGLTLPDEMKFDDWQELGRNLGHVHRWTSWALGDWLNHGEEHFGEDAFAATEGSIVDRYDVASRVTGLAHRTLVNIASVCGRIARVRRRVELWFGTHEPVAPLEPDEQTEWLQRAVDEGMKRDELRDAIRAQKGGTPLPASSVEDGDVPGPYDQLKEAARHVFHQGQRRGDEVIVPIEPWARLAAALGEERY
jgi:hypothetical protein